ncbi:MAG TPA: D-aminoacylase [Holophaga sp.]|nr:D-aminoacylase [Holophaga sp.]
MEGAAPTYDTLIRRARILDGTGAPAWTGDLGIRGDRIAALGDLTGAQASNEVDAAGLCAAPGFVDTHTHDDLAVFSREAMEAKLSQGVTTVVVGNCGISPAPLRLRGAPPPPLNLLGGPEAFRFPSFADYARALREAPLGVNVAALVGHGALRVARMEDWTRPAGKRELDAMRADLEAAMAEGAAGLSTGLAYPTNCGAPPGEVEVLARAAAEAGGRLCMHVRDEFDGVMEATREAFAIARKAGAFLVLSHQKVAGTRNRGRARELLALYGGAGVPFALDAYPYEAGSTVLDPAFAAQSTEVRIPWSDPHPEMAGRTLAEAAAAWGVPEREALDRLQPGGGIYFHMDPADVDAILAHPRCMVGSDGLPHDRHPHPRLWGTFPRYLRRMALDRPSLSLEEAVRRITALPAETFALAGRGRLAPGCAADLVLFDPAELRDRATYEEPRRPSEGIREVYVNGVPFRQGAGGRYLGA